MLIDNIMIDCLYLRLVGERHQMVHKRSRLGALRITDVLHLHIPLCDKNTTTVAQMSSHQSAVTLRRCFSELHSLRLTKEPNDVTLIHKLISDLLQSALIPITADLYICNVVTLSIKGA